MRSSVRWLVVAMALVAAGTAVPRASAQDIRELERRLDAAVIERNAATAALTAYRAGVVVVPRTFTDTIAFLDGLVRIITSREFHQIAQDAGAQAEALIRHRAGAAVAPLRGTVFAMSTDSVRRAEHGVMIGEHVNGREANSANVFASGSAVARFLEVHAMRLLGTASKPVFDSWLFGGLPVDTTTNAEWRALRLELVSSPAAAAHQCYAGDLRACKVTLGLMEEADPTTAWYDSLARRNLIATAGKLTRIDRAAELACLSGRDAECIALLRTSPQLAQWSAPPGSGRARLALTQQAFALGAPAALVRLAASADTPSAALGAIAGAPIDSVVAQWQRHAHDGGIESEIATPIVAMSALGWIVVMGALSLRSSRWR